MHTELWGVTNKQNHRSAGRSEISICFLLLIISQLSQVLEDQISRLGTTVQETHLIIMLNRCCITFSTGSDLQCFKGDFEWKNPLTL